MGPATAIELYKIQHDRFKHTKDLQWKVNLSLWTLLAFAIYYSDKIANRLSVIEIFLIVIFFFTAQVIFSFKTQASMEADKKIMLSIVDQLNEPSGENIIISIIELTQVAKGKHKGEENIKKSKGKRKSILNKLPNGM